FFRAAITKSSSVKSWPAIIAKGGHCSIFMGIMRDCRVKRARNSKHERILMNEPTRQPIRYGMFIMPFHPPIKPLAQCHDEDLELIVKAEELGFSEFWIGEHHTMKYETIVMPEIFIGRALGATKTIRLGPAPACLNQHHPAHVAGRLAFLDHLSKGRLNVCFGPGSVTADQELFGADPKNAAAMTEEAIDMILSLWTSEPPYELPGKFWSISLRSE